MFKKRFLYLLAVICSVLVSRSVSAQEFPIAVGNDTTVGYGAAFDGKNFFVAIQGDTASSNSITAQFVSQSGALVGSRIPLGVQGLIPIVAFDGANYLMAWNTSSGTVYGQFVNPSGTLSGSPFIITTSSFQAISGPSWGTIVFGDTTYLITFLKSDTLIYGQRVSRSGELIGSAIQVSTVSAREGSIAFDGKNYLMVWVDHYTGRHVYGQFIGKSGTLVGSNFVIDGSDALSDNPVSVAFDGSKYLVAFHDEATNEIWNLYARFVSTSGVVDARRITICDSTKSPGLPVISFDGKDYMIIRGQNWPTDSTQIIGQFYDTSGATLGNPFVLFSTLGSKVALFGGPCFGGHSFLVITNRVNFSVDPIGGHINFWGGQVYGTIIQATNSVHDGNANLKPEGFSLSQNYPNPFNPSTVIGYHLPTNCLATLKVFDVLGREVGTLFNENQDAGYHSVTFNGSNLPSGVYFCRLQAGSYHDTKKLLLLK